MFRLSNPDGTQLSILDRNDSSRNLYLDREDSWNATTDTKLWKKRVDCCGDEMEDNIRPPLTDDPTPDLCLVVTSEPVCLANEADTTRDRYSFG